MSDPSDTRSPSAWRFARAVAGVAGWRFWIAVALTVGQAAVGGLAIVALIPLVQAAGVAAPAAAASSLGALIARLLGDHPPLGAVLAVFVALTAAQGLLLWAQARMAVTVQQAVVHQLRGRIFSVIADSPWITFTRQRVPGLLSALVQQVDRVGYGAYDGLSLAATVVTGLVYGALAMAVSVPLTLVVVVAGGALARLAGRRRTIAARLGRALTEGDRDLVRAATEMLAGMRLARAYGRQDDQRQRFDDILGRQRAAHVALAGNPSVVKVWFDVGAAAILSVVLFLGLRVFDVPPVELLVLLVVCVRLAPQIAAVQIYAQSLVAAEPAWAALRDLERELAPEPHDLPCDPRPLPFERALHLHDVSFSYDRHPVLAGVDLVVPAGACVAVVGPSGVGKSTLVDVIVGLLRPSAGEVRVDDSLLDAAHLADWRRQIGYVPQDALLFHDTIRANLRWAAPDATEDDLVTALQQAAADFVFRLPDGLDTVVGERGVLLSGGECQRIALARALVRRPRLLVLDEATSALDVGNERLILEAIRGRDPRMAVLIVSHRLSAVREADRIDVLEDGRVVESGAWRELVADPEGRLARACRAQGIDAPVSAG